MQHYQYNPASDRALPHILPKFERVVKKVGPWVLNTEIQYKISTNKVQYVQRTVVGAGHHMFCSIGVP